MPPKHRAARTAPRLRSTLVATTTGPVALAAVGAFIAPTAQAAPTTNSVNWDAIAACESSENWSINTGNGFSGGLQFTDSTWKAFGGSTAHAYQAPREAQIAVAERTLAGQSIEAWPVCGAHAHDARDHGTTKTPKTPTAPEAAPDKTPAPAAKAGAGYTVVAGDTLSKIATAHHSTVAALADANHLAAPDVLAVGQHLTLGADDAPADDAPAPRSRGKAKAPDDTAAAPHAVVSGIVGTARTWIGTAYRWGGNTRSGVDCSGLTSQVFSANGKNLPRTADAQMNATTRITRDQARPGDLVFGVSPDGTAHHVGVYIGGGQQIDAPTPGSSVGVHQLYRDQTVFGRVQ
jgi:cell wall-associated NlpC family hydrolase